MAHRANALRGARSAGLAAIALVLAGCYGHNYERRDSISPHAGTAMAANRVIMMRDPWPPGAWDKDLEYDGIRMRNAVEAYHDPNAGAPEATAAPDTMAAGGEATTN